MRAFFAAYLLWVAINTINSINNPSNRVSNNSCCVCCEVEGSCNNPCDIYLRFCLRPAGFDHSDPDCPLLELSTPKRSGGINLALPGPWPGSLQLFIRGTHIVGDPDVQQNTMDDVLIDNIYIEIGNITSFSPLTPLEQFEGDYGLLEARLQFEVNCDTNRYGPYCDVECYGQNDSEGHYLCDQNGNWECQEGYQNLETNCTECVAANGCMNGYCDGPLNCICIDGWSGGLCNKCIPSEECSPSGGYCLLPGQCLCRDGYSGDNCTIAPTTTADSINSITASTPEVTILPTPSLTNNPTTTLPSTKPSRSSGMTFLRPTVGGVFPAPLTENMINLPIIVVAAVGGLLLLLIIIIGIVTLIAIPGHWGITRHRNEGLLGRVYEISTAGSDTNDTSQTDENHLLQVSSSPTSFHNDVTFTTFRNANISPEQTQRGFTELHVYYHRNSPEPPSVGAMEGESEPGMQSVEMDFPSGYTDPWPEERKDSYLHWSSMKSGKSEFLSEENTATGIYSSFNDYQFN